MTNLHLLVKKKSGHTGFSALPPLSVDTSRLKPHQCLPSSYFSWSRCRLDKISSYFSVNGFILSENRENHCGVRILLAHKPLDKGKQSFCTRLIFLKIIHNHNIFLGGWGGQSAFIKNTNKEHKCS